METLARYALPIVTVGAVINGALYNVEAGHRAVIFDRLSGMFYISHISHISIISHIIFLFPGLKPDAIEEGTHFLIPYLQKPIIFDVRTRPRNISTTTGSKDMQTGKRDSL
jgi:prohibitin 1